MRTPLIHGSGRVWRAASLAASGVAVVLTIGAFGAVPAHAGAAGGGGGGGGEKGQLVGVFVVQPTTTQVNEAVTPAVVVRVENGDGQVDRDYNGPVVLDYAVNRLGAPLPAGNEVNAVHGTATFSELTFSQVGFGFELTAQVPGESESEGPGPWPWQQDWNWMPDFGNGMSQPSSPFDIVGQLLRCGESEGSSCTTNTVSSDGTSGSATAPNEAGTLEATGGGFPTLSCTTADGVVSFSSTLSKTITVSFAGVLGEESWQSWHKKSVKVCWGSPTPFITKSGLPAVFNPANDEYEGLLPSCGAYRPEPCVSSVWIGSWGRSVKVMIQAPAGDPHMTWGG
jgi:hypothetical protein